MEAIAAYPYSGEKVDLMLNSIWKILKFFNQFLIPSALLSMKTGTES